MAQPERQLAYRVVSEPLFVLQGHKDSVWCVSVFEDERHIVTGSVDGTARVWDLQEQVEVVALRGHTAAVRSVAVLPGVLVSASYDRSLCVWSRQDWCQAHRLQGHTSEVWCVSVVDTHTVVSGSRDTTLRVWDTRSGRCITVLKGHRGGVSSVVAGSAALAQDHAVSVAFDHDLRVWQLSSGECLRIVAAHTDLCTSITAIALPRVLVSASYDRTIALWCLDSLLAPIPEHDCASQAPCQAPCQALCQRAGPAAALMRPPTAVPSTAPVQASRPCTRCDAGSGGCVQPIRRVRQHHRTVQCTAPAGRDHLLTGGADGLALLWGLDSCTVAAVFRGHGSFVNCVAAAPSRGLVISGSHDRRVLVWPNRPSTPYTLVEMCGHVVLQHPHLMQLVRQSDPPAHHRLPQELRRLLLESAFPLSQRPSSTSPAPSPAPSPVMWA